MDSSTPYVILGVLYAYLLALSWTPDTLRLMFASKYWLPEVRIQLMLYWVEFFSTLLTWHICMCLQLPGIAKMFTNEMTLASAWIHLLAVDLFAARSEICYHSHLLHCATFTVPLHSQFL